MAQIFRNCLEFMKERIHNTNQCSFSNLECLKVKSNHFQILFHFLKHFCSFMFYVVTTLWSITGYKGMMRSLHIYNGGCAMQWINTRNFLQKLPTFSLCMIYHSDEINALRLSRHVFGTAAI